ncbi:MAG: NUDIX domain-containing protein [Yaniella sp.]|uniref:NUDIX hydrolase n=1 Tax=Yaniella sp. TaxID=2773929 RepID=UPI0026478079|nr:NUDIX domain-containing protein [Yaniella sp.]MDN5704687.1 NUDIX domain-containing protein [Yaniella sp.]MDN5731933.1 NUDIX domain-containing protein [Yaniella sp.]MDN5742173.1 NUDIX domain-containing protein [Yaniella sp.]MDN5815228.1 NUDIX domain-containing protein [Yaniella sp.]MDN5818525.1 NUDIX domain-containing protein [Yaniella sp.]
MHPNPPISVSAVVLVDGDGRIALVRKHHTRFFIFPGGKPERGEDGVTTAVREVHEELGVLLDADTLHHLGDYSTPAANEAGAELFSQVYQARLPAGASVTAQAEIAELIWVELNDVELPTGAELAPLSGMILEEMARLSS